MDSVWLIKSYFDTADEGYHILIISNQQKLTNLTTSRRNADDPAPDWCDLDALDAILSLDPSVKYQVETLFDFRSPNTNEI